MRLAVRNPVMWVGIRTSELQADGGLRRPLGARKMGWSLFVME